MTQDEIVSAAVYVAFILRDASNNDRTHVSQIAATLLAKSDESRTTQEVCGTSMGINANSWQGQSKAVGRG